MQQINWLKHAIVYSLDIRSFKDSNLDGLGDIYGLLSKFDYLIGLGINCVWIAPFYCTNQQDDGYDVIDYYAIDPRLGTMEDFGMLVAEAKAKDVKIILDLVVNHTSNAHPWFKMAIEQPDSLYHDYYIWKKQKPPNDKDDLVFKTVEDSNWEYEPSVSAYFYHTFYSHQPDLNVANPRVQAEIIRIIDFWMSKGIDGFRIDAVPHILRNKGDSYFVGDPYKLLEDWRSATLRHNAQAILVGEADVEPEEYSNFLNGRKLTGLFNFYLNNYTFLALATQKAVPLHRAIQRLPLMEGRRYLNFLRNHDELDLERLADDQRQQVFKQFAPKRSMIIYDRGIRRRLAPMVDNNGSRIKLAMSLLFTLPGIPVIRYGEEIGMGDDLNLPERRSVRTAMQWANQPNGGFSDAAPNYPLIRKGEFAYDRVNVADQLTDATSLLNVVKTMICIRQDKADLFGSGSFTLLRSSNDAVLAFGYRLADKLLVAVHNFSGQPQDATVMLLTKPSHLIAVLINKENTVVADKHFAIGLPGYGYSWLMMGV
ncbi:alpha-amylase family protein [Parapedobacter sp. ISTM3]|uniref:alpha-amylase family protein n=1 Tax=Parapedobacter sp. ISTM3 TaxID=2800130 RepID=UPI001908A6E5|nr:alpha-amylase family protein [Parapedobacter sp. ISTM3]MBK1438438.1 alpha-amylase family protein [Parapedobacter sp. ISTM3]